MAQVTISPDRDDIKINLIDMPQERVAQYGNDLFIIRQKNAYTSEEARFLLVWKNAGSVENVTLANDNGRHIKQWKVTLLPEGTKVNIKLP